MRFFKQISLILGLFILVSFVPKEDKLLSHVRASIEHSPEMAQKEEMFTMLNKIGENQWVLERGSDDLRVKYVNLQGCIEHALACFQALGEIDELVGVIHTPMPATPLCVRPEGAIGDILDKSIRNDPQKLLTVRSRAQIVREYLMKEGKLHIVYPKGGFEKRNPDQQAVYREALTQFNGQLKDWVLGVDQMDPDKVGATYLFRNKQGQAFAFSIKSRQVNDVQSEAEWGIWLGPLCDEVAVRVNEVFDYLVAAGGPDIRVTEK